MFETVKAKAKEFFWHSDSCHGWDHVIRVHKLCRMIWANEGADLEILDYAAVLHDIARWEESKLKWKICHAEKWAERAKEILIEYNIPEHKIDAIIHCISTHRWRNGNAPESLEAKILFDADKIDSLWAIGIWRCFLFAWGQWAKLHDPNVNIEHTKEYSSEDTAYREFLVKLKHIPDRLFMESSKNIAKERLDFMYHFFDTLNDEW
jgi:uncharacterized protein